MPIRCEPHPFLAYLILSQDRLISREQAGAHGMTRDAIRYRLRSGHWRMLLPGVYLTHPGEPSRRQMLVAALLYAGPDAAIDGVDACRFHGVRSAAVDDDYVHVVAPWGSSVRSFGFVIVRRTLAPISVVATGMVRYVEPAAAVIAATRIMRRERSVLALMSEALQRRVTTYDDLVRAHIQGPPRNARHGDHALETLGAGTRSVPEADFRKLALASTVLPPAAYNVWLRLETGQKVCVDALFVSSAVIHETNGRVAHKREDLFEDMQKRHSTLTTSGFTVLHNPPTALSRRGREVIAQVERCHLMYDGRGMPPGVAVIPDPMAT